MAGFSAHVLFLVCFAGKATRRGALSPLSDHVPFAGHKVGLRPYQPRPVLLDYRITVIRIPVPDTHRAMAEGLAALLPDLN